MALYLKYRPQDFTSMVGQAFVKETLQAAVIHNKTVGAYLLCGPRGTGKTTTARILAKAVNCQYLQNGNPCNKCDICVGINNDSLVDVMEIDAASHTGVDNIREIIEKVQFRPSRAKYKIYIIDEVHMLSKGAFNALLKVLEEPPEYVKFILATTETNKVPDTIISRCQKYDLKNISEADIISRLEYISSEENITSQKKALEYIAANSGGALRNALSLFEQLVVNNELTFDSISKNLGIATDDAIDNFLNLLITRDSEVINQFELLIADGKNTLLFMKQLIFNTKNKALEQIKSRKDITDLLHILDVLNTTYSQVKNSLDQNMTFTIGLLKIVTDYTEKTSVTKSLQHHKEEFQMTKKSPEAPTKQAIESPVNNTQESGNISIDDIDSIFGDDITSETSDSLTSDISIHSQNQTKPPLNIDSPLPSSGGGTFDATKYAATLKANGAKGGVTMSIRAAVLQLTNTELIIKFKTNFGLKSVNNPDTIALLQGGLDSMGYSGIKIKLTL